MLWVLIRIASAILMEAILMSTHNIGFCEDLTKISLNYHQISSNTHLISSAGFDCIIIILVDECEINATCKHFTLQISGIFVFISDIV